jgi:hypothetical protein
MYRKLASLALAVLGAVAVITTGAATASADDGVCYWSYDPVTDYYAWVCY